MELDDNGLVVSIGKLWQLQAGRFGEREKLVEMHSH